MDRVDLCGVALSMAKWAEGPWNRGEAQRKNWAIVRDTAHAYGVAEQLEAAYRGLTDFVVPGEDAPFIDDLWQDDSEEEE